MLISRYINVSVAPLGSGGVFTSGTLWQVEGAPITVAAGGQTSFPAQVQSTTYTTGIEKYFNAICIADQASAANGFVIQVSADQGVTWRTAAAMTTVANTQATLSILIAFPGSWYRVVLTNSATIQTYLILGASVSVT